MPDTGKLEFLKLPQPEAFLRVETGIRQGDEISVHYDPMIAKIIAKGRDRLEAIKRLDDALSNFVVVGVDTNISLIKKILREASFRAGGVDTHYLQSNSKILFQGNPREALKSAAIAAAMKLVNREHFSSQKANTLSEFDPWKKVDLSTTTSPRSMTTKLRIDGKTNVEVRTTKDQASFISAAVVDRDIKETYNIQILGFESDEKLDLIIDDKRYNNIVYLRNSPTSCILSLPDLDPVQIEYTEPTVIQDFEKEKKNTITSPMPCKISSIKVKAGQSVTKGSILVAVEAMKMEHLIRSPIEGVIKRINCKENQIVGDNKILLELEVAETN